MKKVIIGFLLIFCLHNQTLLAQIFVGYYPFQNEFVVGTNVDNLIWGDIRILSNTFWGNINTEPTLMINFKKQEWVNYYTGVGLNLNFFNALSNSSIINGYAIFVGARIKPIKSHRNLHCIFEISPYMNPSFDGGLFRTRLGIAYQFKKRTT